MSFSPLFWHENPGSNFLLALVPVPSGFPGTLQASSISSPLLKSCVTLN